MDKGNTLANIALLYKAQDDIVKALEYGRQGLAVFEMTQDTKAVEKAKAWIAELVGMI